MNTAKTISLGIVVLLLFISITPLTNSSIINENTTIKDCNDEQEIVVWKCTDLGLKNY